MNDSHSSAPDGSFVGGLEDLLWIVPRLMDRTSRQLELSRTVLRWVPCIGPRLGRFAGPPAAIPRASSEIDVLDVLNAEGTQSGKPVIASEAAPTAGRGTEPESPRPSPQEPATAAGGVAPQESQLAVPQYDSLAASQVIPRLAMLSQDDLQVILSYEESNRNRQTIVHKVHQLLSAAQA